MSLVINYHYFLSGVTNTVVDVVFTLLMSVKFFATVRANFVENIFCWHGESHWRKEQDLSSVRIQESGSKSI
jgi:hypothetical protein